MREMQKKKNLHEKNLEKLLPLKFQFNVLKILDSDLFSEKVNFLIIDWPKFEGVMAPPAPLGTTGLLTELPTFINIF